MQRRQPEARPGEVAAAGAPPARAVVVPVYNGAAVLSRTLDHLTHALAGGALRTEIVVVAGPIAANVWA